MLHWSVFHSYHQYHIVLISVAQSKSSSVSPITLLFFFKTVLAILDPLLFHVNFKSVSHFFTKKPAEILWRHLGWGGAGLQCRPCAETWQEYNQRERILFSASKLTYQGQSSALSSSSKQNSSVGWNACLVMQVAGYAGKS